MKDVLQDKPSESAIRIKSLVENIRARADVIDAGSVARFRKELQNLSLPHVQNLLVTLFGMFVDPMSNQVLRANVAAIAPDVWQCAEDGVRFRVGARIDGYRTNLQKDRLEKGVEFLTLVNGRMYETLPARTVALEALADRLEDAHEGMNNYHNEPPVMQEVLQFCRASTDIPGPVLEKLVRIVLRCRLGRGLPYRNGVSPAGAPLYDRFLQMLDDAGLACLLSTLFQPEVNGKIAGTICQGHLGAVLKSVAPLVISERLKQAFAYLLADVPNAHRAAERKEFRALCAGVVELP